MQPIEYLDTAYDSTRPRTLPPPINDKERNWGNRKIRERKLDPLPVECGEYLVLADYDELEQLRDEKSRREFLEQPLVIGWMSFSNPLRWAFIGKMMAGMLSFGLTAALIFELFRFLPDADPEFIRSWLYGLFWLALLMATYFFLDYLIKHNKIPNRNNTLFERRTGLLHLPPVKGKAQAFPFDEFAPYQSLTQSNAGLIYYHLLLGHKYSGAFVMCPAGHMDPWKVYLEWEFYQQFMDVSKPLPDTPSLEIWRPLDPTTLEWDQRMQRPPNFWLESPEGGYAKLSSEAWDAGKAFPWGATRAEAIARGWQPSPFGKQSWWDRKPPKSKKIA